MICYNCRYADKNDCTCEYINCKLQSKNFRIDHICNMKELQKDYSPELFDIQYLNDLIDNLYKKCFNEDCDNCPHKNELDEDICQSQLIMELWRRNKNLSQIVDETHLAFDEIEKKYQKEKRI